MRKILTAVIIAALTIIPAATSQAYGTLAPRAGAKALPSKVKASDVRTLQNQLQSLSLELDRLTALVDTAPKVGPKGDKGDKGEAGANGGAGPAGPQGQAGKDGLNGKDGVAGAVGTNGKDGQDGKGLPSNTLILVGGSCPSGTVLEGKEYNWRVYNGNPFSGVGSELWITACRIQ